jgi:TubC N-terminal docking domain
MTATSLFAELTARGVRLSIAPTPEAGGLPPLRLRVRAPEGALTPGLKEAIERHRADLLGFVFELEERAAIHLERDGASAAEWEGAEGFARMCVRGAGASPDACLRDLAEHHPCVREAARIFGGLEIIGVWRGEESEAA